MIKKINLITTNPSNTHILELNNVLSNLNFSFDKINCSSIEYVDVPRINNLNKGIDLINILVARNNMNPSENQINYLKNLAKMISYEIDNKFS